MNKRDIFFGLIIAVILAIFAFLASGFPDGLERIAEDQDFIDKAKTLIESPLPDYQVPLIKNEKISVAAAGIIGVVVVFIATVLIGKLLKKNKDAPRLYR